MAQGPRDSCRGTLPSAARTRVKKDRAQCHEAARPGAAVSAGAERDLSAVSLTKRPLGAWRLWRARTLYGLRPGRRLLNRQVGECAWVFEGVQSRSLISQSGVSR